jgi:DNA-binding MarR family transcriptional regulator
MSTPHPSDREDQDDTGEYPVDPRSDARIPRAVRSIVCITREFERVCRDAGVSLPQYRLMLFLRHGPERAGELAAKVAIKRPTLTALVNGLEKEQMLRRVADRNDGRGVRIELTPAGLEALQETERCLSYFMHRLSKRGDRESILDAMDELSQIVDDEIDRRMGKTGNGT